MSAQKTDGSVGDEKNAEEKDWVAAKAAFDNLKSNKPRPVSILWKPLLLYTWVLATNA